MTSRGSRRARRLRAWADLVDAAAALLRAVTRALLATSALLAAVAVLERTSHAV